MRQSRLDLHNCVRKCHMPLDARSYCVKGNRVCNAHTCSQLAAAVAADHSTVETCQGINVHMLQSGMHCILD